MLVQNKFIPFKEDQHSPPETFSGTPADQPP